MTKPKVALCLAGEARTYDLAYPLFKQYIIDPLEPDIFISTWDSDFLMSSKESSVEKYIEMFQPKSFEIEQLNSKAVEIDRSIDSSDISLLNEKLLSYLTVQNKNLFRGQKYLSAMIHSAGIRSYAMVNMFYKIWRCYHLCYNYAELNGTYDIVIRSRPDLSFNQPLDLDVISKLVSDYKSICLPCWAWDGQAVPDAFAYGSMYSMHQYSDIYLRLEEYYYTGRTNMKPDFLIKTHLENCGINIMVDNMLHECLRPKYNIEKGLWYA